MRKKLLFALFLLSCMIYVQAQQPSPEYNYIPLSKFVGDTLNYLTDNFEVQDSYFKGKKVEEVLKYYEKDLPINIVYSETTNPLLLPQKKRDMESICITYHSYEYFYSALRDPTKPITILRIRLAKPLLDDYEYWHNMPEFDTDREEAWYMKDLIVDGIEAQLIDK